MSDLFNSLVAVVQYRRRHAGAWHAMAAFDSRSMADRYAEDCASEKSLWEYRVVEPPPPSPKGEEEG